MANKGKPTKFDATAKAAALRVYRKTANRAAAADAAGVHVSTLEKNAAKDPEFRAAMQHAKALWVQDLEAEALRRAVDGVEDYRGNNPIRKYSDTLLLHLLKRKDPEQHGDHVKIDQTTTSKGEMSLDLRKLSKESREDLRRILERERETE